MHSKTAVANAKQHNYPVTEQGDGCITVKAPDGYKFTLVDQDVTGGNKCFYASINVKPEGGGPLGICWAFDLY